MIKWILFGSLFYLLYKAFIPMLSIFRFNESIKEKKKKESIHLKVSKMDIQDAEFEDNIE
ncbi:MAG: hypothetical protein CMA06_03930 [Euryarchaeota archaeon]|jgi:hypothetical protein|nr:hypothetical protein [Euryarchaeota archaeon]|tara:strand:- start:127 stop:306 length:180 start_codon:yes stop_codon:yes gene_type:complete